MMRISCTSFLLLLVSSIGFGQTGPLLSLRIIVHDANDRPAARVQVMARVERGRQFSGITNEQGIADINPDVPGTYSVTISKANFQTQTETNIAVQPGEPTEVRFTLIPMITDRQRVTVNGDVETPLEKAASPGTELHGQEVKRLPLKAATVADALPLVPGVTRAPDGQVQIEGVNESQSAMLVNSLNVTDPQTGQFGITVPTDSVQSVKVFKTPFEAQYGGFTAGVVSVETKPGSDKWHVDVEDPFPEFRIRSGHLVGVRNASPIFTFGGPVKKDQIFSSTSIQYVLDKRAVRTLQFPANESILQSLNLFTQSDVLISTKHVLTTTLHVAPQTSHYLNLDFFNPRPVTPNLGATDTTTSLIDRYSFNLGLLQSALTFRTKDAATTAQGRAEMVLGPTENGGNYFSDQDRKSTRFEVREDFTFRSLEANGLHNLAAGAELSRTATRGQFIARPVDIVDLGGTLRRRINFVGGQPYAKNDLELSSFLQDHWSPSDRLTIDLGSRFEEQRLSNAFRVAPRIGFAATLSQKLDTVLRGGIGLFYETVPLSPYLFANYPLQEVTTFDRTGKVIDGPRLFANVVGRSARLPFPFVDLGTQPGDFVPSSFAWNFELEQPLGSRLKIRAGYLQNASSGLILLSPTQSPSANALVLSGTGKSKYRQFEITTAFKLKDGRRMFFSYVRSHSLGNLNQFGGYLGDTPYPIVQTTQSTNLDGDVPNRFLAWGTLGLPLKLELAPTVELRSGFPYAATDVFHSFVGIPNSNKTRFPTFFSLDTRISRDFSITPKYGVRFSVTGLNLTDHFNALAVHSNLADPQFGTFFGSYPRRLRLDFDVLF